MQSKHWLLIAGISSFLAVALGAFGAHALEAILSERGLTDTWETANHYHFYHSLALLAIAWLASRYPAKAWQWIGLCFLTGILFFSGSLYAMGLSGVRVLGAITPIGGVFFLIGWAWLALAGWRKVG